MIMKTPMDDMEIQNVIDLLLTKQVSTIVILISRNFCIKLFFNLFYCYNAGWYQWFCQPRLDWGFWEKWNQTIAKTIGGKGNAFGRRGGQDQKPYCTNEWFKVYISIWLNYFKIIVKIHEKNNYCLVFHLRLFCFSKKDYEKFFNCLTFIKIFSNFFSLQKSRYSSRLASIE